MYGFEWTISYFEQNVKVKSITIDLYLFLPRSPVKTNPFAECDRPRRAAKLHAETPMYGPALPAKSSRVLTGKKSTRYASAIE